MKQKTNHFSNIIARKVLRLNNHWASKYWKNMPLGDQVKAYCDDYMALWYQEKSKIYPEIDSLEEKTTFNITKNWLDELALHTQIVIKKSPLCYQHGRILYSILSAYLNKHSYKKENITIFETGTARGFSSVVMAKALFDRKACGKIITFDVLPHHTQMYWNCIDDCEKKKSRAELLEPWQALVDNYIIFMEGDSFINLKNLQASRIHFAFLDGAHKYSDVFYEFSTIASHQKDGDIIIFDDYNIKQFPGLVKAVNEGCHELKYDKKIVNIGSDRSYVIATKS